MCNPGADWLRGERSMSGDDLDQTRTFWDNVADDWRIQVGDDGDGNRRLNSDPVLWKFLGDVDGLAVLDAGCGTGYLAAKLRDRGARVTGIDFSDRMLGIARSLCVGIDFRLDSCSELHTLGDEQFDAIVANYVLMDTPDLRGTMRAFSRVLKSGGMAVVVFSHPCFPQGRATRPAGGTSVSYGWEFPYFSETKRLDPPWAHFTSEFIWFHRPLSDYWKAFTSAGFGVEDFEEPRITEDRFHLPGAEKALANRDRPYSVAFKLRKR
jgi:SAM-dependent methyltransferase